MTSSDGRVRQHTPEIVAVVQQQQLAITDEISQDFTAPPYSFDRVLQVGFLQVFLQVFLFLLHRKFILFFFSPVRTRD
jgi:hypothetical protein